MTDAFDPGPMGDVQKKLPLIGRAVAGALEKIVQSDRLGFCLFVFDSETHQMCFTSDVEPASLGAAISEWLANQSH